MLATVAIVYQGWVYGLCLVDDGKVTRAWIDPEMPGGVLFEKLTFTDKDPQKVMAKLQNVLDVRYIPEVDPKEFTFKTVTGNN